MGLFKILRAAAVHNNKSAGGRGRREGGGGGGQERHGLSPKNRLPEDGRGCSQVKDAPHGEGKRKGGTCKRDAKQCVKVQKLASDFIPPCEPSYGICVMAY